MAVVISWSTSIRVAFMAFIISQTLGSELLHYNTIHSCFQTPPQFIVLTGKIIALLFFFYSPDKINKDSVRLIEKGVFTLCLDSPVMRISDEKYAKALL